jgi:hypothetical protein
MYIFIQLTNAGSDTGPFDLYASGDLVTPFASGVAKATLLTGINYTIADGSIFVRVVSTGTCTNSVDLSINLVNYLYMSLDNTYIRKGIRDSVFVVDKTLTETGFSGVENVDWENIKGIVL